MADDDRGMMPGVMVLLAYIENRWGDNRSHGVRAGMVELN